MVGEAKVGQLEGLVTATGFFIVKDVLGLDIAIT